MQFRLRMAPRTVATWLLWSNWTCFSYPGLRVQLVCDSQPQNKSDCNFLEYIEIYQSHKSLKFLSKQEKTPHSWPTVQMFVSTWKLCHSDIPHGTLYARIHVCCLSSCLGTLQCLRPNIFQAALQYHCLQQESSWVVMYLCGLANARLSHVYAKWRPVFVIFAPPYHGRGLCKMIESWDILSKCLWYTPDMVSVMVIFMVNNVKIKVRWRL